MKKRTIFMLLTVALILTVILNLAGCKNNDPDGSSSHSETTDEYEPSESTAISSDDQPKDPDSSAPSDQTDKESEPADSTKEPGTESQSASEDDTKKPDTESEAESSNESTSPAESDTAREPDTSDESVTETETEAPHEHQYSKQVFPPDCTNSGYTLYTCTVCGNSYKDNYTPANGHKLTSKTVEEATCRKAGKTLTTCANCDYKSEEVIPLKAHTFGEWQCVNPAGNGTRGLNKRICSMCSIAEYQDIPALIFKLKATSFIQNNVYSAFEKYNSFASPKFLIPGLGESMVPQGMDIWDDKNVILVSGYFSSNDVSPCSVLVGIDMDTGKFAREYYLKNADGSNYTGHAGGVAITSKNLFISDGGKLHRIPLESIEKVGLQGELKIVETIKVPVRASFCNYSGGYLWVGDFYYETSYPTDEFRHMKNNAGKTYYAWSVGYKLDPKTENEFSAEAWNTSLDYATPDVICSIDEKIQGFTVVSSEYIALSQSYGRKNNSKIYLYENVLGKTPDKQVTLNGKQVPLWFLDTTVKSKSYTAPPMSEGLASKNGKLYILYESGADKYRNDGGKYPTDRIWVMNTATNTEGANLRIMTNNVWDNKNNLPAWKDIGEDCSEEARSQGFALVYTEYLPDVVNFQEMSPTMVELILKHMKDAGVNYSLLSYASTTPKDDTCIIYNPETVTLIESGHHIYEYGSNKNSKSYTWGLFKLKSNGKRFISLSTHLWWKSEANEPGSDELRRRQAAEVVALADELIAKYDCPFFVQGDFNTKTTSTAFKEFLNGNFEMCYRAATKEKDSLRGHHKCDSSGYSNSMYSGTYLDTAIDHMLVKNKGTSEVLSFIHIVLDFYYKLSDHFPLYIDVAL